MKLFGRNRVGATRQEEPTSMPESSYGKAPFNAVAISDLIGVNATPLAVAEAELADNKSDEPNEDEPEAIEKPKLLEGFKLQERIQDAIRNCELVPSPEVQDALKGYYTDHYNLADIIDTALNDQEFDEEELLKIISSDEGLIDQNELARIIDSYQWAVFPTPPSASAARKLIAKALLQKKEAETEDQKKHAKEMLLRCASRSLGSVLFQETSLGISTLQDEEMEIVRKLYGDMTEAASDAGADFRRASEAVAFEWPVNNYHQEVTILSPQSTIEVIEGKKMKFWQDCRMAGQLEFHNTGHMPLISSRGNKILPRTEQFRRHGTMNVQTAADKRMHSVVPHFSEVLDPNGYRRGDDTKIDSKTDHGSATIALPLALIIQAAPFARDAKYAVVEAKAKEVTNQKIPHPNNSTGSIGIGENDFEGRRGPDRVFFSSDKVDAGPDTYELPIGPTCALLFFGDNEMADEPKYGYGEGFPIHITSQYPNYPQELSEHQQMLLQDSAYAGKIVVPLRRGVLDFMPENSARYPSAGRKSPDYNANPLAEVSA